MAAEDRRDRAGRRYAAARSVLIVALAISSFVAYAVVSVTINGEPSVRPFQGWVVLLQPADELPDHQVMLVVAASVPGAPGDHPQLTYTVAACGDRPFNGVLILGGDARLTDLRTTGSLQGTVATSPDGSSQSSTDEVANLTVLDVPSNERIDLGPAQMLHLQSASAQRCVSPYSSVHPPAPFVGDGQITTGRALAPVQRNSELGWWTGPRSSQVWPLVGSFPGVSLNDLGVFTGVRGLLGQWTRPIQQYFRVDIGGITSRALVDQVRPEPTDTTRLVWDGAQPLQPTVLLTNVEVMGRWQAALVAAAVGLGIGGALLASLLFEISRPPSRPWPVALIEPPLALPRARPMHAIPLSWLIIPTLIGIFLLLRRVGKRRVPRD